MSTPRGQYLTQRLSTSEIEPDEERSVYVDIFMGKLPDNVPHNVDVIVRNEPEAAPSLPRETGYERHKVFPSLANPVTDDDYCSREFARAGAACFGGAVGKIASKALVEGGASPLKAKAISYGLGFAASHPVGTTLCLVGTATSVGTPIVRCLTRDEELLSAENRARCSAWAKTAASYADPLQAASTLAAVRVNYPEPFGHALVKASSPTMPLVAPQVVETMVRGADAPSVASQHIGGFTSPAEQATQHFFAMMSRCCESSCNSIGNCLCNTCTHAVAPACEGGITSLAIYGVLRLSTFLCGISRRAFLARRDRDEYPL